MEGRRDVRKCSRCGLDIATGERDRDSRWGGARLPLDLDVFCDACLLTFFTCEADRPGEHATVREQAPELVSPR